MDTFDDQRLERTPPPEAQHRGPRLAIMLVAVAGLLAGAGAAWWWTRTDPITPAAVATNSTEASVRATEDATPTLPPVNQMDTFLRALLGALSAHPDFVRWLTTDDLVQQMANGIDRVSRGQSPAAYVPVLRPVGDFEVTRRPSAITVDPASYQRYDRLASLVESVEARGVAEAYRTIEPRLDEAYRALGRTEGGVDNAVDTALQLLLDTPVTTDPVTLVPGKGATYAYSDPELERLTPIQKQLLRMGPDNVRRIQARLRAIRAELTRSDSRVR